MRIPSLVAIVSVLMAGVAVGGTRSAGSASRTGRYEVTAGRVGAAVTIPAEKPA
jgi:hypothetical protein